MFYRNRLASDYESNFQIWQPWLFKLVLANCKPQAHYLQNVTSNQALVNFRNAPAY